MQISFVSDDETKNERSTDEHSILYWKHLLMPHEKCCHTYPPTPTPTPTSQPLYINCRRVHFYP